MSDWLRLENFSVFTDQHPLIHPLSLQLPARSNLAVFGPTGSGKSTLLKGIVGLLPFTGKLTLFNRTWHHPTVRRVAFEDFYKRIGFAFQHNALFESMTTYENVFFAQYLQQMPNPRHHVKKEAEALLRRVGLWEHCEKKPEQLSGGMRKRLAIARAMIKQPDMIVCDDPLAGLDPISAMTVLDMLMDIAKQRQMGVIISVHSTAVVKGRFTHALVLQHGKSLFFGSFDEFQSAWPTLSKKFQS